MHFFRIASTLFSHSSSQTVVSVLLLLQTEMLPGRKKKGSGPLTSGSSTSIAAMTNKSKKDEEDEIENLKKEIEAEQKHRSDSDLSNTELEKSVKAMERNVLDLESGHLEADDSEVKQKYDNQRQLNVQLQEQKRWLEHELEQV